MKRRRYGWGWVPVTWQGWIFTILQVSILIIAASQIPSEPAQQTTSQVIKLMATLLCVIISLVLVGSNLGPKPHWRWGKKATDNPDEDF